MNALGRVRIMVHDGTIAPDLFSPATPLYLNRRRILPDLASIAQTVAPVFARYPIQRAWLFGSWARGDNAPDSDVDLCYDRVDGKKTGGIREYLALHDELESALGCAVDLCATPRGNYHKRFKENVMRDRRLVYERGQ